MAKSNPKNKSKKRFSYQIWKADYKTLSEEGKKEGKKGGKSESGRVNSILLFCFCRNQILTSPL